MSNIDKLLEVMRQLRDKDNGCPWDIEQDFRTIAPYTIEEAYEVADAIDKNDLDSLRDELGDLLLQVVFHAQMAAEEGIFEFDDVVNAICDKMVRRHPHVFGTEKVADASSQTAAWERQKAGERAAAGPQLQGWLAGIPAGFPSLMRALKLGKRAARAGFDWPDVSGPIAKIREELDELTTAVATEPGGPAVDEEIGDLLFAISNLARHVDVDPEGALRRTNLKFEQRFSHIETRLAEQGKSLEDATLQEMDDLWNEAKTLV